MLLLAALVSIVKAFPMDNVVDYESDFSQSLNQLYPALVSFGNLSYLENEYKIVKPTCPLGHMRVISQFHETSLGIKELIFFKLGKLFRKLWNIEHSKKLAFSKVKHAILGSKILNEILVFMTFQDEGFAQIVSNTPHKRNIAIGRADGFRPGK